MPPTAPHDRPAPTPAAAGQALDRIDLHLIRVLHMVLVERSVSRAALRLGMHQPAVSAALRRLRRLTGDPLLVRSGASMVLTDAAVQMIEPTAQLLQSAQQLFGQAQAFDPLQTTRQFNLAASDYLDPLFLPRLVADIKHRAPQAHVAIHALTHEADYRGQLASGEIDLVVGNWLQPPADLHLARLLSDEVVCLVSTRHPAVRRGWDVAQWLAAEHIAPMPTHLGARGIIDQMLDRQGLARNIVARSAYFGLIPAIVADSLLVLTTGRQYCARVAAQLPLAILPCPVAMPPLLYYQLWHERCHASPAVRWLRERVRSAAAPPHG